MLDGLDAELSRRRESLIRREHVHVACPYCDGLVPPVDGLLIDRSIRLLAHIADRHEWQYDLLRIAFRTVDRALEAAA